jgi:hypothetical protein
MFVMRGLTAVSFYVEMFDHLSHLFRMHANFNIMAKVGFTALPYQGNVV